MFSRIWTKPSTKSSSEPIERLKAALRDCDAVVVGAGAGLSTAAGFTYSGERFEEYFSDFEKEYGFHDMYSGGGSTPTIRRKSVGLTGAAISGSTAIRMRPSRYMTICGSRYRARTISS